MSLKGLRDGTDSVSVSRTPSEAARPQIQGQWIAWYARLLPPFAGVHWLTSGAELALVHSIMSVIFKSATSLSQIRHSSTWPLVHFACLWKFNTLQQYTDQPLFLLDVVDDITLFNNKLCEY